MKYVDYLKKLFAFITVILIIGLFVMSFGVITVSFLSIVFKVILFLSTKSYWFLVKLCLIGMFFVFCSSLLIIWLLKY